MSSEDMVAAPEVSNYLASRGWQRDGELRGASIWRLGIRARLLVPDLHQYDDADELILAAIRKIAKYEKRPEADVRRDIAEPMVDAQFFRTHPDAPSGFAPLPIGVKVAQNVLRVIKAAASTVDEGPQLRYNWRRPPGRGSRVEKFLDRVLLGSGPPGSYVLTARVPTESYSPQRSDMIEDAAELSGRAVAEQLHASLQSARRAASQAIEAEHRYEAFYTAVERGISVNLCRALSELGGDRKDQRFEIGFSWAYGIPVQDPKGPPEVAFTGAMPSILAKAADELEAMARAGEVQIAGSVSKLHHERGEQPRIQIKGELRVPNERHPAKRSIWVVVSTRDYDSAFEAQRRGQDVEASGNLTTSRRRLELIATNFRVIR